MNPPVSLRLSMLALISLAYSIINAQTHTENIKATWVVEKFETEINSPQSQKAKKDAEGLSLAFENNELVISKRTASGDSLIKKGVYTLSGNTLTLGKDHADIIELSDKKLTIKIPGQGILYLAKL